MARPLLLIPALLLALLPALGAGAAADPFGTPSGSAALLAQPEFLPVEQAYRLAPRIAGDRILLEWWIAPGYYLYRDQFAVRIPSRGDLPSLPFGIEGDGRRIYDEYYEKELEVFYDWVRLEVALPGGAGRRATLAVTSQGCADAGLCYPPQTGYLAVDLDTATVRPAPAPAGPVSPRADAGDLGAALGFALLGGLILNLMPCVFPVLSIKVMSLTAAHAHRGLALAHGLAYTLGVTLSFVAVAALLLALRGAGAAVGWGFQLQSPGFVAALAYLFFLMALGFAGQLPWTFGLARLGRLGPRKDNLGGSFLTGVLATAVASPCTAPFMGTALGIALSQAAPAALGVFAALGLGMALPFLVLTAMPRWLDRLPPPGPWMETLRQLLAFPLYATVLWLLWVLGRQTDIDRVSVVGAGLLVVALAVWLAGRSRGLAGRGGALALLVAGLALPLAAGSGSAQEPAWEAYSQVRLEQLRRDGVPVFVNLTADWCVTCLANERLALSSPRFRDALERGGIRYLKGDWTRYDPEITELLRAHGRSGVPLYLYFPPGEPARILPQLLTEGIVLDALGNPGALAAEP
ncbi:MAG: protein-disulfide reductase DsbD family protein [Pseudomonadota bacterium]